MPKNHSRSTRVYTGLQKADQLLESQAKIAELNKIIDGMGQTLDEPGYVGINEMALRGAYGNTYNEVLKEASAAVEEFLSIEDRGWLKYGNPTNNSLDLIPSLRQYFVYRSRRYFAMDPLCRQAVRLWTDYSFSSGISYQSKMTPVKNAIDNFWNLPANRKILSARGQRKASDKLIVDGEIFFIFFLGAEGQVTIRWIDPLEISEIITDPDDVESQKYFKRTYLNQQGKSYDVWYRSISNIEGEEFPDSTGRIISPEMPTNDASKSFQGYDPALVYHLPFNGIGQRGMPLLMSVMDWVDEYRRFLASYISIARARSRFAWKQKIVGGPTQIANMKAVTQGKYPQAGSTVIENAGSDLEPIKFDSSAADMTAGLRMIKLQICSGVGIPEHYFGDAAVGSLATAKSIEMPLLRMFSSYQKHWSDAMEDIINVVLDYNKVSTDNRHFDLDFPEMVPQASNLNVAAIVQLVQALPQLANSPQVIMQALMNIGIENTADVMDWLKDQEATVKNAPATLVGGQPIAGVAKPPQPVQPELDSEGKPVPQGIEPAQIKQPSVSEAKAIKGLNYLKQAFLESSKVGTDNPAADLKELQGFAKSKGIDVVSMGKDGLKDFVGMNWMAADELDWKLANGKTFPDKTIALLDTSPILVKLHTLRHELNESYLMSEKGVKYGPAHDNSLTIEEKPNSYVMNLWSSKK